MIHAKSNGLVAANNHPAETHELNNNNLVYPTCTPLCEEEETLIALFALAGHVVRHGRYDDYTVCKFGHPRYSQDLIELHAFAVSLGVCHV